MRRIQILQGRKPTNCLKKCAAQQRVARQGPEKKEKKKTSEYKNYNLLEFDYDITKFELGSIELFDQEWIH